MLLESRVPGPSYRWEFVDAEEVLPQQIERQPAGPSFFVENAWVRYRIDTIQNALLKLRTLVVSKSEGAVVRISKGSPAASRMQLLTSAAIPSRCEKQLTSSEEVSTTAVFGFATLALEKPSAAFAHAAADSAAPRLLQSGLVISHACHRAINQCG